MEEVNPVILNAEIEVELKRNKSQFATLSLIYQKENENLVLLRVKIDWIEQQQQKQTVKTKL